MKSIYRDIKYALCTVWRINKNVYFLNSILLCWGVLYSLINIWVPAKIINFIYPVFQLERVIFLIAILCFSLIFNGIICGKLRDVLSILEMNITAKVKADYAKVMANLPYRYPGRDDYALRNINLKVCPFEHLAIVGDNGAGKTTFIKLLTRLYEPTEGAILIDGRNIKEYDYEQYMSLFSPVFQDFELLAYSIKENITFDNYDKNRFEKVTQCVGLQETIEKLANHENTFIKKEFESSGVELSGGEKQKVAIARAFYKDAVIALLDEPTAAIDPMAEYEVFRNFFEFSKQKTTFLISHRMGSTRFCDRIIVFENGEIVEVGTHKELIERDGVYNRMYQKQASYYVGN